MKNVCLLRPGHEQRRGVACGIDVHAGWYTTWQPGTRWTIGPAARASHEAAPEHSRRSAHSGLCPMGVAAQGINARRVGARLQARALPAPIRLWSILRTAA